jgi:hypothetical protein
MNKYNYLFLDGAGHKYIAELTIGEQHCTAVKSGSPCSTVVGEAFVKPTPSLTAQLVRKCMIQFHYLGSR